MTVPVQTAATNKVVTASPVVAKAVTVANGTKAVITSAVIGIAQNVASTPTTVVAAVPVNTVTVVSPATGVAVNHGANSDNGTVVYGKAVLNRDVTS